MKWRTAYAVSVVIITLMAAFGGFQDSGQIAPENPGGFIASQLFIAPIVGVTAGLFWGSVLWVVANAIMKILGQGRAD